MILSGIGTSVVSLDQRKDFHMIEMEGREPYALHSLLKYEYLKYHKSNQILFQYDTKHKKTLIKVEGLNQVVVKQDTFTTFNSIYDIDVAEMDLYEILLMQSIL